MINRGGTLTAPLPEWRERKRPWYGIVTQGPCKEVAHAVTHLPLDFVIADLQHGLWSWSELEGLLSRCGMASPFGVVPLVRLNVQPDAAEVGKALDCGAWGLIIPFVESAEQVHQVRTWACYPPLGMRSLARSAGLSNTGLSLWEYVTWFNQQVMILSLVETPRGLDKLPEIASVSDGVLFGVNDLQAFSGWTRRETLAAIVERLLKQPLPPHKLVGCMGVGLAEAVGFDPTFRIIGSVRDLLMNAIRSALPNTKRESSPWCMYGGGHS